jgi:hypothetical protein
MKLSTSPPPDNPRMYIDNKQGAEIKKKAHRSTQQAATTQGTGLEDTYLLGALA